MNDIGHDVLGTSINTKNGAISAQLGDSVSSEAIAEEAEWFQHVGFASRPSKAEPGKSACQVLSMERTDRDVCFASRDLRYSAAYGALGEGETCLYATGPNGTGTALVALSDDGQSASVNLSVKQGNSSGGSPVSIRVATDGKITLTSGSAKITIDQSGSVTIEGTSINLGALGGTSVCVNAAALQSWVATVGAGLNGLGVVNTPPVGLASTVTKST